ncbi:hypothetical protein CRG98_012606 [Punica granatum]|uniref:Uncharacterized protein n=1 Tax=Punica granatum TaxID=22663 RepID=A0A2I0KER3_PUNGR|nr:hypothetical protein CRG98_012606 [Punica granatum]
MNPRALLLFPGRNDLLDMLALGNIIPSLKIRERSRRRIGEWGDSARREEGCSGAQAPVLGCAEARIDRRLGTDGLTGHGRAHWGTGVCVGARQACGQTGVGVERRRALGQTGV